MPFYRLPINSNPISYRGSFIEPQYAQTDILSFIGINAIKIKGIASATVFISLQGTAQLKSKSTAILTKGVYGQSNIKSLSSAFIKPFSYDLSVLNKNPFHYWKLDSSTYNPTTKEYQDLGSAGFTLDASIGIGDASPSNVNILSTANNGSADVRGEKRLESLLPQNYDLEEFTIEFWYQHDGQDTFSETGGNTYFYGQNNLRENTPMDGSLIRFGNDMGFIFPFGGDNLGSKSDAILSFSIKGADPDGFGGTGDSNFPINRIILNTKTYIAHTFKRNIDNSYTINSYINWFSSFFFNPNTLREGGLVHSNPSTLSPNILNYGFNGYIQIGGENSNGADGYISHVAVYPKALTEEELQENFNFGNLKMYNITCMSNIKAKSQGILSMI